MPVIVLYLFDKILSKIDLDTKVKYFIAIVNY